MTSTREKKILVGAAVVVLLQFGLMAGIYVIVDTGRAILQEFSALQRDARDFPRQFRAIDRRLLERCRADGSAHARAAAVEDAQAWLARWRMRLTSPVEETALARLGSAWLERLQQLSPDETAWEAARLQQRVDQLADRVADEHSAILEARFAGLVTKYQLFRYGQAAAISLLVPLVALVGWLAYERWVRPLRSKLVESQRLLEQREKLASLGTLAAGVAHEINNPLMAIKARLYATRKHLSQKPSLPITREIDIVEQEIDRLGGIVREVLAYARPPEPRLEPVSLTTALTENAEFLRPMCIAMAAHLEVCIETEAQVLADRSQLRQILLNLVRNSLEAFGETGGRITLGLRRSERMPSGALVPHAEVTVTDNGPGIPTAAQSRLFDPFFTTKKAGTGLGLSLVLRLMENHRGEVSFRSRSPRGTVISLHFPLGPSQRADNSPSPHAADPTLPDR